MSVRSSAHHNIKKKKPKKSKPVYDPLKGTTKYSQDSYQKQANSENYGDSTEAP